MIEELNVKDLDNLKFYLNLRWKLKYRSKQKAAPYLCLAMEFKHFQNIIIKKYRNLLKSYHTPRNSKTYKIKIAIIKQESTKLFDIHTYKFKKNICHNPETKKFPQKK